MSRKGATLNANLERTNVGSALGLKKVIIPLERVKYQGVINKTQNSQVDLQHVKLKKTKSEFQTCDTEKLSSVSKQKTEDKIIETKLISHGKENGISSDCSNMVENKNSLTEQVRGKRGRPKKTLIAESTNVQNNVGVEDVANKNLEDKSEVPKKHGRKKLEKISENEDMHKIKLDEKKLLNESVMKVKAEEQHLNVNEEELEHFEDKISSDGKSDKNLIERTDAPKKQGRKKIAKVSEVGQKIFEKLVKDINMEQNAVGQNSNDNNTEDKVNEKDEVPIKHGNNKVEKISDDEGILEQKVDEEKSIMEDKAEDQHSNDIVAENIIGNEKELDHSEEKISDVKSGYKNLVETTEAPKKRGRKKVIKVSEIVQKVPEKLVKDINMEQNAIEQNSNDINTENKANEKKDTVPIKRGRKKLEKVTDDEGILEQKVDEKKSVAESIMEEKAEKQHLNDIVAENKIGNEEELDHSEEKISSDVKSGNKNLVETTEAPKKQGRKKVIKVSELEQKVPEKLVKYINMEQTAIGQNSSDINTENKVNEKKDKIPIKRGRKKLEKVTDDEGILEQKLDKKIPIVNSESEKFGKIIPAKRGRKKLKNIAANELNDVPEVEIKELNSNLHKLKIFESKSDLNEETSTNIPLVESKRKKYTDIKNPNSVAKMRKMSADIFVHNKVNLKECNIVLEKNMNLEKRFQSNAINTIVESTGENNICKITDVPKNIGSSRGKRSKPESTEGSKEKESQSKPSKVAKKDVKSPKFSNIAKTPDIKSLNFINDSTNSNGKLWNLKISSWNINGIRAWLEKDGLSYIHHEEPDIMAIQETKCSEDKIPPEIKKIEGYHTYWLSADKDGYSGVGLLTKLQPIEIKTGLGIEEHDSEGRVITAEYENFFCVVAYVPNAGRGLVRLDYRMKWDKDFCAYLKNLDEKKPVILCGDLNVAHEEIDLANPKTNKKNAGFTKEEREGFSSLLKEGFIDTFRHLYPDVKSAYTFWTYMMNARAKNVGWRLDYFVVSNRFLENLCDNVIRKDVYGSDHCPVALFLTVE